MADINTLLKQLGLEAGMGSQLDYQGLPPDLAKRFAQDYAKSGKLPHGLARGNTLERRQIMDAVTSDMMEERMRPRSQLSPIEMKIREKMMLDQKIKESGLRGLPPETAGASMRQMDEFFQGRSVPPEYMGNDVDAGIFNDPEYKFRNMRTPNSVVDPKTGEYLGEYEFMPQNGLLYR